MKCPVCGGADLIHDTRDLTYTYKGESTVIQSVTADWCPACDESITATPETGRVMKEMVAFNKQVNAAIVPPEFIKGVRKKLALDQRAAGELFGGGVNAFSRYEKGRAKPPLALVQLFKLLNRHPNLLAEMREPEPETVATKAAPPKARKVAAKTNTPTRKKVSREAATA